MGVCDDAQRRHLFVVRLRIPSRQVGNRVHALFGGFVQQSAAGGDQYIGRPCIAGCARQEALRQFLVFPGAAVVAGGLRRPRFTLQRHGRP